MNPKKAERSPWELFFIGLLYASLSVLIVDWIFLKDTVLSQYTSMLIVTFTVMFSIPFFYFLIRFEEKKDAEIGEERILMKEHGKAIAALVYLFLGFIIAFSFWYMAMPKNVTAQNFKAQIEQYCAINMPNTFEKCITSYGVTTTIIGKSISTPISGQTGVKSGNAVSNLQHFLNIFINNIYVLIFILVFSLTFGAGAIFILAWNASVIAAAIGIFTEASFKNIHLGLMRYLIHGIPEISAYFVAALAGGILSIAIIRHEVGNEKFWCVLQDSVDLIIMAIVILVIAAFMEVYITPALF